MPRFKNWWKRKPVRRSLLLIVLAAALCIVVFMVTQTPRNDRNWVEYLSRTTHVTHNDTGTLTFSTIKDWQYEKEGPIDKTWLENVELDPNEVKDVWFIVVPFGALPIVGHTYLSFEFNDGSAYAFSIEARREIGEDYHTWTGLMNTYELIYTWSTERNAITMRMLHNENPQRMYKLNLTDTQKTNLFIALAEETTYLSDNPRFYNTLTDNCTNAMARAINKNYPGSISYSLSWTFPGGSDKFLMRQGFIETTDIKSTQAAAIIQPNDPELKKSAYGTPELFSAKLREVLHK